MKLKKKKFNLCVMSPDYIKCSHAIDKVITLRGEVIIFQGKSLNFSRTCVHVAASEEKS